MVPSEIKNVNSLTHFIKFKTKIRKWAPKSYSCYLSRAYNQILGFGWIADLFMISSDVYFYFNYVKVMYDLILKMRFRETNFFCKE